MRLISRSFLPQARAIISIHLRRCVYFRGNIYYLTADRLIVADGITVKADSPLNSHIESE